ncbi:hypothetical protein S40285_01452 [Stachybotrys chlorohalonatus IBT 40285]|uniref:DH domain-containing protein n=1 Tax=Stachybotrys chlorohalonatus (strain IBT 40285) TaxID=1283841 RepID=A0A084QMN2_STAC4|nr:hypothetical protein S40285_01452 [Stachybotrys chlorohalonata IBT 40285]
MVRVTDEVTLSPEHVTLYHASDPLLGHLPILIFHGPSTTANYTHNSSRVQIHIFTPAGFQCFPRITISPNSSLYNVVDLLPREDQGDEVFRALAFGLYKYFTELPDGVKNHLRSQFPTRGGRQPGSGPELFGKKHAADLVTAMTKSDNTADVIASLQAALQTQHIGNVDVDFVLPPGAVVPLQPADFEEIPDDEDDILDPTLRQYGGYTPMVKLLGEPVFLPTSRLRRAPSKPTSLNRSKSFNKDQKYELRMKLGELVDTEERYVSKLGELVRNIAHDFRDSARSRPQNSLSPSEKELERLFPRSADQILKINSAFMEELRRIMDESDEEATRDMETTTVNITGSKLGASARTKDPSGALAIARLFLEWFPKFTDCYQDYIKASQHFPTLLTSFLDQQSSFRQRVNQTGEQTIRSTLIEPVQRLPRYSLLIDQIVGSLPMTHPALQPMLKARDIITNICSMDDPLPDKPHVASRFRNMVESWPMDLEPQGRLVVAADFIELVAPFQPHNQSDKPGVFLLFSDCIVLLKRVGGTMIGRDLIREIDKPSAAGLLISMTNAAGGPPTYDFVFTGWHPLADVRFTESADGDLVWMTSMADMRDPHTGEHKISKSVTSRCFLLQDSYEGKGSKWDEEVVKARVEARFPETERENPCWTLRSVRMPDSSLGLHAAVFQEGAHQLIDGRREPAAIRVVVDHEKGTKGAPVGHYGVEIVVNVTSNDLRRVSMLTVGLNNKQFQDDVALEDFLPTLSRRVIQLLSSQYNVTNARLTGPLVAYYTRILRRVSLYSRAEKTRSFLPSSPVKLISSFWNGSSSNVNTPDASPPKPSQRQAPMLQRNPSQHSIFNSFRSKDSDHLTLDESPPENPLVRLEQTFTGYVAALQCRKGSIIGRALLNRSMADELSVNDLYNRLIENPYDYEVANDVSVEVMFVAFEKFLRIAWTNQMGPVMTKQSLDILQERANKRMPGEFADFVNFLFGDMTPQNRRAFTALIKLLADLLDGCGNDSDRGAMTVAFAELLVSDGTASSYINLLDRLVEDSDRIFDEPSLNHTFNLSTTAYESINSTLRGKSHTGSVTSNTSSLRRKFGLDTLLRQNSKDERPSVWRTLSKHRNPATGEVSSISKGTLGRPRSIDDNSLPRKLQRRPGSRDRPPIVGAFDEDPRPASSHRIEFPLDTIGEPANEGAPAKTPRHKRRSSLSDLKSLMAAASIEDDEPLQQPLQLTKPTSEKFNSTPKDLTPSRIPVVTGNLAQSLRSPRQKENVADPFTSGPADGEPLKQESSNKSHRHSRTLSTTNIPTLRPARSAPPGVEALSRSGTSPTRIGTQKLRLQSPQKLRERLQTEKKAVEEIDASLQSELSRIGQEMARVNTAGSSGPRSSEVRQLFQSVQSLEKKVPELLQEVHDKHDAIQRDMESTLKVSEAKVRAIDQLYKETAAENELLYEKFNGELGKLVRALKGKGKDDKEELMTKMKEQGEEVMRLKKENNRLKREMVSLRAALKSGE